MISYDARAKGGRVGYLSISSFSLLSLVGCFHLDVRVGGDWRKERGRGGILNIFAIPFRHISSPYQLCDTENICYSIIDKLKKL